MHKIPPKRVYSLYTRRERVSQLRMRWKEHGLHGPCGATAVQIHCKLFVEDNTICVHTKGHHHTTYHAERLSSGRSHGTSLVTPQHIVPQLPTIQLQNGSKFLPTAANSVTLYNRASDWPHSFPKCYPADHTGGACSPIGRITPTAELPRTRI